MTLKWVGIKRMDAALWQRVRVAAIKKNKTITTWLTEAIRTKLRHEKG